MTLDWDGKIRMDCSSPNAMASLIAPARRVRPRHRQRRRRGPARHRHPRRRAHEPEPLPGRRHRLPLRAPHALAGGRGGRQDPGQLVDDRPVAEGLGRRLLEVPVGFKWFVPGLLDGSIAFGGEESAGASFLRRDGSVWTTDKDGILLCLLASEITAVTGQHAVAAVRRADRALRRAGLRPRRRTGRPGPEGGARQALGRAGHRRRDGRRADHGRAHRGARQRRGASVG